MTATRWIALATALFVLSLAAGARLRAWAEAAPAAARALAPLPSQQRLP
jgi:hypothetical protein